MIEHDYGILDSSNTRHITTHFESDKQELALATFITAEVLAQKALTFSFSRNYSDIFSEFEGDLLEVLTTDNYSILGGLGTKIYTYEQRSSNPRCSPVENAPPIACTKTAPCQALIPGKMIQPRRMTICQGRLNKI